MRKGFLQLFVLFVLVLQFSVAGAEGMKEHGGHDHAKTTTNESSHADVVKHNSCSHCGMNRDKFAHSRMLVTYADGSSAGVCSIHCVVTELKASRGKVVKAVEVADMNSKKLVSAEKAVWVIGGSKKGVMTRVAKWAFAQKSDAEMFIKKHGGMLAGYKEAFAAAEKD